jgi:hypothetical protein
MSLPIFSYEVLQPCNVTLLHSCSVHVIIHLLLSYPMPLAFGRVQRTRRSCRALSQYGCLLVAHFPLVIYLFSPFFVILLVTDRLLNKACPSSAATSNGCKHHCQQFRLYCRYPQQPPVSKRLRKPTKTSSVEPKLVANANASQLVRGHWFTLV